MEKVIVSLIGYGGSGKTSTAKHLQEKYGFTPFTFSAVIREYAARNGISLRSRVDYANTHAEIIQKYGWDYTLKIALGLITTRLCIDDVRSRKFAEVIHKAGGVDIAFECPVEIRFSHASNHPDKARYPATLDAFMQNERDDEATSIGAGLEFKTGLLMQEAGYHIDASGSLANTFQQVDEIIEQLLP